MIESPETETPEPIAIVGMACRFPGAPEVDAFWRNLRDGVESIRFFSEAELVAAGVSPALYTRSGYVAAHGRLGGIECFDAEFFGISPREAESMDPQHRVFLECAWEAIEHAGHDPERVGERFGVVASAGLNAYLLRNILSRTDLVTPENFYALFIANDKDFLPTRVSYKLNLRGPSLNVNTACSSSLVAVHVACQMLWSYQCDAALAGGVSLQVPQDSGYLYQPGGIVSPDGRCRAFDASANGAVTGSGAGAVVLKRLSDAQASGDTIHAVIRGSAVNNDGAQKAGYTAPSIEGQAAAIAEALAMAGIGPESIGYVEAHGTGTPLGDPIEISALTQAFGAVRGGPFCRIGSVKTNIGHLDTAAGVAGLIKAALALRHEAIPPTLNFKTPNPKIDFAASPFSVCAELTPWPRTNGPRRAGVSSFGIGGTNAHVVLEESPGAAPSAGRPGPRLFVLSARSRPALDRTIARLATRLETSDARPEEVAWTLAEGRKAFPHAAFVIASSTRQLAAALNARRAQIAERPDTAPRVAFLFPDHDAVPTGAGRDLYESEPTFRAAFDAGAAALISAGTDDVRAPGCANAAAWSFAWGHALAALWRSWGIAPSGVLGQGAGEIAAAVCAGAMSLAEGARAVTPPPASKKALEPELKALVADGCTAFVELGLATTLAGVARSIVPSASVVIPSLPPAGECKAMLSGLGELWLAGAHVDWRGVFAHDRRQRVPLPTYPFEPSRHWIEPAVTGDGAVSRVERAEPASGPAERQEIADWFYVPTWTKSVPLLADDVAALAGRWLVFSRGRELDRAIVAALERAGGVVTVVERGARARLAAGQYVIRPEQDTDYVALVEALHAGGAFPDRVLHCWTIDATEDAAAIHEQGFNALLRLTRALSRDGRSVREIAVLTSGLAEVHGSEALDPHKACLFGPVAVIPSELPGTVCRCIDVDTDAAERAGDLVRELSHPVRTSVTAWRGRHQWMPRFEPIHLPAPVDGGEPFRQGGTYLITGGVGGLGLLLAEHLAKTAKANLVLTGRRSLPPEDTWDEVAAQPMRHSGIDVPLRDLAADVAAIERRFERELNIRTADERPGLLETANALAAAYAIEYFAHWRALPAAGARVARAHVYEACQVLPQFRRLVDHLLGILEHEGWIRAEGDAIAVLGRFDTVIPAAEQQKRASASYPGLAAEFEMLATCAASYPAALAGQIPAVSVLFPDGGRGLMVTAAERTEEYTNNRVYRTVLAQLLGMLAARSGRRPFRILEVGGGNAIMTGLIAEQLRAAGAAVEYVFTDIGRSFVMTAEAKARERGYGFMTFATFDISRDPASQGFEPGTFDAVIGLDVVHATPSVRDTVANLRPLLAQGALLCLVESARTYRWNDMVWGLAEGWWLFRDAELRNPGSPLLSTERWETALAESGFSSVLAFPQSAAQRATTGCSLILAQQGVPSPAARETTAVGRGQADVVRSLARIRRHAAGLMVRQVDVADENGMERVVSEAEARFGRIDGVIHAAAVEHKALIASRTGGVEEMEFRPKVDGTQVLDRVFSRRPLDFMVLYSSITAVIGGAGQVGYCGANAFLDAFAARRSRRRDELTVSINWGRWQGAGLARDFESWHRARTGEELLGGMTADEGLEALRRILRHRIAPQVAVMTREWRPEHGAATVPVAPSAQNIDAVPDFTGSDVEKQLAGIWRQILGTTQFDRNTPFQDIGGDSLVGIQMVARIKEQIGVQLPSRVVFDCPTIAELSTRIQQTEAAEMEEGTL